VENGYWDYALAVRQVEIFQESVDLALRQLDNIRTRIEVGQLSETEESVANAELALREQQLINARTAREKARLELLRLLNPVSGEGWDRQITLSDTALVPEVELGSALEHEALALKLRPELNEARLEARSGELETVQTANGLLPRLDLFIILGKTGYSQSFANSFSDLDGPGYDFTAGLDFELPLHNRAAKALDTRAQARYQQALQSIENLKQLISLDVRNALLEIERSLQQIVASASRRVLQEEVVRAEIVRFQVGTATALDVARVQRDLLESRINEVEAIVNYRKALTDLYLLDGTLLLRRGIEGPGAAEVVLQR
jgi:outer membrane protein TolC